MGLYFNIYVGICDGIRNLIYRGFRKYRIRKYRISGNTGHFDNPQIEIFH